MSFGEAQPADINRPVVNFTPSIWGEYFMTYASKSMDVDNTKVVETIVKLKKEVKKMIADADAAQSPYEKFKLIDAIQRLGVDCHFEKEIETILEKLHHNILDENCADQGNAGDLYTVALRFRLLRQQGYNVPSDIFRKFKDNEGKFKESLADDVRGILSLYEATHLRVHGENILDQALIFTTTHLRSLASGLSSPLSDQVNHALKHPVRKSMRRREARRYLSVYEQDNSHSEALLTLAKLDFNQLQQLYQKELSELTRWWKDFDSRTKLLSFSRDRMVECLFWSLGIFFEAKFSLIRTTTAKLIAVLVIIDDIYDSFGTMAELEIFTEALERWDISTLNKLPEYMKLIYKATLEFLDEVEENVAKGRSYCVDYAKKALLRLFRAYFHEAKWLHGKEIPKMEEYLPVGYDTAGSESMITMAFTGMGDVVTRDSMEWVLKDDPQPKIVTAMSIVGRLMNDIGYHKSEFRRSGRIVASAVECYIKQYGATEEEAVNELTKKVVDAWKDVNEECLRPTIPRPLIMRVLDLVRTNDEMYRDGDGFTQDVIIKDMIESLIINPVPV